MKVDVAILCPTPEEFLAMEQQIDAHTRQDYILPASVGTVAGFSVAVIQAGKGEVNTAAVLQDVFQTWTPKKVFLVGIAGGFPEEKVRRGDVVIATTVHHFDFGKLIAGHFVPRPDDDFRCDRQMIGHASLVAAEYSDELRNRLHDDHPDPSNKAVVSVHRDCYVASSSKVVDDPSHEFFVEVRKAFPEIHAVEMEGAGAGASVWLEQSRRQVGFLMIRGISDESTAAVSSDGKSQRKLWRGFAAKAAAVFTRLVLEHGIKPISPPPKTQPSNPAGEPSEIAALRESARQKFLAKPIRLDPEQTLSQLGQYNRLFSFLVDGPEFSRGGNRFLEELVQHIHSSGHQYPLRVDGPPGIGKSTLLSVVYLALLQKYEDHDITSLPVYIDLKYYDRAIFHGGRSPGGSAQEALARDLKPLKDLSRRNPELEVICIVDGIEEYVRLRDSLEQELMASLSEVRHRKIVGFGVVDGAEAEAFRRSAPEFSEPEKTIELHSPRSGDHQAFVDAFLDVESVEGRRTTAEVKRRRLSEAIRRFGLHTPDLFTIAAIVRKPQLARDAGSLSHFIRLYCEDFLSKETAPGRSKVQIRDAATLAFNYSIMRGDLNVQDLDQSPAWRLLHRHQSIRHFLVALHVVQTLREFARKPLDRTALQFVFPQYINHYGKQIVNESVASQRDIVKGARKAYSAAKAGEIPPHVCYLIGRVTDLQAKNDAVELLQQWKKRVIDRLDPRRANRRYRSKANAGPNGGLREKERPSLLLLVRTIYISLTYLGDPSSSDEYIRHLLASREWNALNRGFHLEYYNDIPYVPRDKMSHTDPLCPFPNTFATLHDRVSIDIGLQKYPLREIELFTLVSLAQHRLAAGVLADDKRKALLALIERVLDTASIKLQPFREYLVMMHQSLESSFFKIGSIAERLVQLKSIKRAGWLKRGIHDGESVADHMMSAYLLGLLYLPDDKSIDKREILDMILIHDLAEAITGDLLPAERTDPKRQEERHAFAYLKSLVTYEGVFGLDRAERLWEKFEARSSTSAKIAWELDKLENLLQLLVYRKAGRLIPDFDYWRRDLLREVKTAEGAKIATLLQEQFG